jgi:aerobic carbon-monoxide dehydrogenase small subunit
MRSFRKPKMARTGVSTRSKLETRASKPRLLAMNVNGQRVEALAEPSLLLVEFVRDRLGLKGTHIGCLTGDCGACTLMLNGLIVKSCTVLSWSAEASDLLTIEGLAGRDGLHPIQKAFWDKHGFQCGFCLPGLLFSALELLREVANPTEADIRRALSGNLCRCTGYQTQVAAVAEAADRLRNL